MRFIKSFFHYYKNPQKIYFHCIDRTLHLVYFYLCSLYLMYQYKKIKIVKISQTNLIEIYNLYIKEESTLSKYP